MSIQVYGIFCFVFGLFSGICIWQLYILFDTKHKTKEMAEMYLLCSSNKLSLNSKIPEIIKYHEAALNITQTEIETGYHYFFIQLLREYQMMYKQVKESNNK